MYFYTFQIFEIPATTIKIKVFNTLKRFAYLNYSALKDNIPAPKQEPKRLAKPIVNILPAYLNLLEQGVDLRCIQKLLEHKSSITTEI